MERLGFKLEQTQNLFITPQLQQAIKLLQLSTFDLAKQIETELTENPFLELNELDNTNNLYDNLINVNYKFEEFNKNNYNSFEDSSDFEYLNKSFKKDDRKQQFLENAFSIETGIYDHLLNQLNLININNKEFYLGQVLISSLDSNGYLLTSLKEIAKYVSVNVGELEKVLKIIQNLDPPGIAGRDLKEVLLIQMNQIEEKNELARKIIQNDLQLLKKRKYKIIITKYSINIVEFQKVLEFISRLEPIPARKFNIQQTKYIVPDISVKKVEKGFSISINDSFLPSIKMNLLYKKAIRFENLDNSAKNFLDEKYSKARLLVLSLKKRRNAIYQVVEKLIEFQFDFFLNGSYYLKPLKLRDIADKIEMHESTVSRVTSNKYIETPWGIFSLKYFFSRGLNHSVNGMTSTRSIQEMIKKIIMHETNNQILSDNKIVNILSKKGIKIARRTVAKYRKTMKIDSSHKRR